MTVIVPNLPASDYHNDLVADVPTLSASIAVTLLNQSPAHARHAHPRLNPHYVPEAPKEHFEIGDVVHAILLEGKNPLDVVEIIEADSWRSNDAKQARELARAAGRIPLLGKHYFDVLQMVEGAREQIAAHQAFPPLLTEGKPEVTLVWEEDGVACRCRLDWLRDDFAAIDDVKTVGRSAKPEDFARALYAHGYEIKAAFYLRGVAALRRAGKMSIYPTPVLPTFRWIAIEKEPPYALSVVTPGPDVLALADDKVDTALRIWKRCLAENRWPAYDPRVATAELPGWEETRWLERSVA